MTDTLGQRWAPSQVSAPVIDADVHVEVPGISALLPYLSDYWREICTKAAFRGPTDTSYPAGMPTSALPGTRPGGGGPPRAGRGVRPAHGVDPGDRD